MQLNLEYKEYYLANGLRVILHKDTSTPIAAVNIWYHVGSWNEKPGKTGFAHLFEHMMFEGSAHVGSSMHFRLLQSIGSSVNGSTSFNRTNYYETVPSHHLEMALWMEADRMGWLLPAMTQEKLSNQIDVVKNERRQTVDNQPYGSWLEKLLQAAYPKDFPYHWPIIGYMEDISNAKMEDVSSFFQTYYAPANASLCVAGDFEENQLIQWIEKYFSVIKSTKDIPPVKSQFNGMFKGEFRQDIQDNVQLPRIYQAYHIPAFGTREWYVADFLADLLSSGKSSRLHHSIVYEQQLAQHVQAYSFQLEGTSLMLLMATAQKDIEIGQLEKALNREIEQVIEGEISDLEIERMKNQIEAHKLQELQSVTHIADTFNNAAVHFNDPGYLNKELDIYLGINKEEIRAMADTFLKENNKIVLNYLPR